MDGAKVKIAIVDDDKFLLDMYAMKFNEKGYDVKPFLRAAEVLDGLAAGDFIPDIFVVDVIMPEMDGFTLVDEIHKRNLAPNSVAIILSNLGQKEDIERGLQVGADGYIIKASATPSEVVAKVEEITANNKKKS